MAAAHRSNSATVIFFLGRFASITVAEFAAVSAADPHSGRRACRDARAYQFVREKVGFSGQNYDFLSLVRKIAGFYGHTNEKITICPEKRVFFRTNSLYSRLYKYLTPKRMSMKVIAKAILVLAAIGG